MVNNRSGPLHEPNLTSTQQLEESTDIRSYDGYEIPIGVFRTDQSGNKPNKYNSKTQHRTTEQPNPISLTNDIVDDDDQATASAFPYLSQNSNQSNTSCNQVEFSCGNDGGDKKEGRYTVMGSPLQKEISEYRKLRKMSSFTSENSNDGNNRIPTSPVPMLRQNKTNCNSDQQKKLYFNVDNL